MQKVQYLLGIFFNNETQKRILSTNKFLERMTIFGLCLSGNPKWVSRIDTLLEADFGSLAIHFRFGCPYELLVGDNLSSHSIPTGKGHR